MKKLTALQQKRYDNTIIRVGAMNNFNQTEKEFKALERFKYKGRMFTNSSSFTAIDSRLPSIVTINPLMVFEPIKGSLENVKAVRIKLFYGKMKYITETRKCIEYCVANNLPMLFTFFRFKSGKLAKKYCGSAFKFYYSWKQNYYRLKPDIVDCLKEWIKTVLRSPTNTNERLINYCDSNGHGCPSCQLCSKLTYNVDNVDIKSLNLSISGIKDINGRQGLCGQKCPGCFAKYVCFQKRPQCDIIYGNKKQKGMLKT